MAPGLDEIALGVAGTGEASVRVGLLARCTDGGCYLESGGVTLACSGGLTCVKGNVPEAIERLCLKDCS
jgi:hypothetical protein